MPSEDPVPGPLKPGSRASERWPRAGVLRRHAADRPRQRPRQVQGRGVSTGP